MRVYEELIESIKPFIISVFWKTRSSLNLVSTLCLSNFEEFLTDNLLQQRASPREMEQEYNLLILIAVVV
jgi:hypothetical protein